ncbi:MAG: helix-turn-helix transcriptional regulator [Alphaproteobacteria bacterium]|nr:helix-turn-helix transcriptional regulator [Alphaproteobacteria bacterium]
MITAAQLRAARGLLDWSRGDLAKAAKVSQETIKNIEHGVFRPQEVTETALIRAFAAHGVEFVGTEGVVLRKDSVLRYEGVDGFKKMLDEVYAAAQQPYSCNGGDKPIYATSIGDEAFPQILGNYFLEHVRRMNTLNNLKMRLMIKEKPTTKIAEEARSSYREYRFRPKGDNANASFYVYGDKIAIINFEKMESGPEILIISSAMAAKAYREQFESMWNAAQPIERMR